MKEQRFGWERVFDNKIRNIGTDTRVGYRNMEYQQKIGIYMIK
jgi:hypothetical protein